MSAQLPSLLTSADFDEHVRRLGLTSEADIALAAETFELLTREHREVEDARESVARWQSGFSEFHPVNTDPAPLFFQDGSRLNVARYRENGRLLDRYFQTLRGRFPARSARVDWIERAYYRRSQLAARGDGTDLPPDLIALCEEIAPDAYERPDLLPLLNQFDEAVDAIARPHHRFRRSLPTDERSRLLAAGDAEGLLNWYLRLLQPGAELREVVIRFAPRIAGALDEAERERFLRRYEERLYADILRPTRIDQLIADALSRDDLDDGQGERIRAMKARLEALRASVRRRLIALDDARYGVAGTRAFCESIARNMLAPPEQRTSFGPSITHAAALREYRAIGTDLEPELRRILDEGKPAAPPDQPLPRVVIPFWTGVAQPRPMLPQEYLALPQFQPLMTASDFEEAVERLVFDDEQSDAARLFAALYDEYRREFDAALAHTHAVQADIAARKEVWRRENPDATWRQEPDFGWMESWNEWTTAKEQIEARFQEDIDAILDPVRRQRWRTVTRDLRVRAAISRREVQGTHWLFEPRAVFAEIGVNPDESPELSAAAGAWMERYSTAVDKFFAVSDANTEWILRPEIQRMATNDRDRHMREWETRHWAQEDQRYAIRDAAGEIAVVVAALGDERGEAFARAVTARRHPSLYVPSPVETLHTRLAALALPDAVSRPVMGLLERAMVSQDALRRRLVRTYEAYDTGELRRARQQAISIEQDSTARMRAWQAVADSHPALPLWREYRDLIHATCRQVRLVIPDADFERLPPGVRVLLSWVE